MPKKIKIFDVAFDVVTKREAVEKIFSGLSANKKIQVVTPNPEMLLETRNNTLFRDVLNKAFLSIPDGVGVLWASTFLEMTKRNQSKSGIFTKGLFSLLSLLIYPKFCTRVFPERLAGADLFVELIQKSAECGMSIFLLGAREGVAEKVKEKLEKSFPGALITGTHAGSPAPEDFDDIRRRIVEAKPHFLFVAFGAPAQDLWIASRLHDFPSVKLAIGVGGAFDFIAGTRKRAPRWMQNVSLEWLARIAQEPSRWRRIFNATIKFPFLVIRSRISGKF